MAIIDVIKFDGYPEELAWKHPNDELGTWTQLVVHQTQEAVLFKDGRALDLFGPGRHTLSTANIPLLNKIVNLPFGGKSPFKAEIWFVNKVNVLDVKWGTSTPVKLQDPKYNIIVPVRAFGQFGIQIEDSRKFLVKLVGTLDYFGTEELKAYFRGLFMMNFNSILSSFLVHRKISVLEINAYLEEMSNFVREKITSHLSDFGIRLMNLFVKSVNFPEDDPSIQRLRDALARRAEMDIVGYTYQNERSFDVLEGAAKNEGSASSALMGAGMGLGMGVGMGGAFGNLFSDMTRVMDISGKPQNKVCPSCRQLNYADAKFCSFCGNSLSSTSRQSPFVPVAVCNNCGEMLPPNSKFCPACGDKYHPCPMCGADNPEDSLYCIKCNEPLPRPCPKCGQEVQPGQKFCMECGFNLQQGGG